MKKRFLSILLLSSLLIGSAFTTSAAEPVEDAGVQENAVDAYEALMSSFSLGRSGDKIYPDYYGGSHINDNGQLVVYVTDGTSMPEGLSEEQNVIYEPCEYSYNELLDVMDSLNSYKFDESNSSIADNFNEFGVFDSENRVIVKLDDLSEQSIQSFKENVCDSKAIVFEQGTGPVQMETNVNAGCSVSSGSSGASVGYRVKKDGVVGFVTAGHFVSKGDAVKYNGTAFASCTVSRQSGKVDGAFCKITDSSYKPTNTLSGTSNELSTTISEPGVGTVINKIGRSTGHTSGKVLSTNVTVTFTSGKTISNLTSADYASAPGDSGCVVYSYVGSTNTRLTLGIHTGAGGTTRFYTKANEINSALGTSRY